MNKKSTVIAISFIIGLGLGLSYHFFGNFENPVYNVLYREKTNHYQFINPLLGFEMGDKEEFNEFDPLEKKISAYFDSAKKQKKIDHASVYFRDLNNGRWTGIDENRNYSPASMLKVITMLAYFRLADSNPAILSKKLFYDGFIDRNKDSYYKPKTSLVGGQYYPVEELIRRAIIQSGNNSQYLLGENLDEDSLLHVYTDLGLPVPNNAQQIDFMSAKAYSFVFRVLYNATYFSRDLSEKALNMLSQTEFTEGLQAGIPEGIRVAHKFGERFLLTPDGKIDYDAGIELHDCGIIYNTKGPYFLCVMTKGHDFPDLEKVISDVSRITYEEVEKF